MFPLKVYYQIFIHDKNGKLVRKTRKRRSRSFVIQFLEIMYSMFIETTTFTVTNLAGTEDIWLGSSTPRALAIAGETEAGILVGSGITPPTNNDFILANQIAHGSGSGQLQYGSQAFIAPSVVGLNVDIICTRPFANGSGAIITVREIGFAVGEGTSAPTTTTGRLIIRDVLPTEKNVSPLETLTVQYTFRTTV